MMEIVGYTDKAKRDERYSALKQASQGTRGVVKFSEVERLDGGPATPKFVVRRYRNWLSPNSGGHSVRVRERQPKSRWRTIWCVGWSA